MRAKARGREVPRRPVRLPQPALLLLLHQVKAHGYTLVEMLADQGIGGTNPCSACQALRDVGDCGWVTSDWDSKETLGPPSRVCRRTAQGGGALNASVPGLREPRKLIGVLVGHYDQHVEQGEGEHHERHSGSHD